MHCWQPHLPRRRAPARAAPMAHPAPARWPQVWVALVLTCFATAVVVWVIDGATGSVCDGNDSLMSKSFDTVGRVVGLRDRGRHPASGLVLVFFSFLVRPGAAAVPNAPTRARACACMCLQRPLTTTPPCHPHAPPAGHDCHDPLRVTACLPACLPGHSRGWLAAVGAGRAVGARARRGHAAHTPLHAPLHPHRSNITANLTAVYVQQPITSHTDLRHKRVLTAPVGRAAPGGGGQGGHTSSCTTALACCLLSICLPGPLTCHLLPHPHHMPPPPPQEYVRKLRRLGIANVSAFRRRIETDEDIDAMLEQVRRWGAQRGGQEPRRWRWYWRCRAAGSCACTPLAACNAASQPPVLTHTRAARALWRRSRAVDAVVLDASKLHFKTAANCHLDVVGLPFYLVGDSPHGVGRGRRQALPQPPTVQ